MATSADSTTTTAVTNSITTPVADATSAQTGWEGSIVMINAFNASGSDPQQGYAQTLAPLPFTSGAASLAPGDQDSITLDTATPIYNVIAAQADNLFPALMTSEMASLQPPYDFPPLTVQTTDSSSCANALAFYQNISALPTSNLAKQFAAACTAAGTSAVSAGSIDSAVDAFFQGTKQYQNVTLDTYTAATTYVNRFANAWADFQSSYTYYLYKGSGAPAGSGGQAVAEGTVTLTQAPGPPSPTDTSGGYTITYDNGSPTPLYFSNGQLVSSTSQDEPLIALACSYAQLSQFTGNASDAATLVPVIFGTANGVQVIGIYVQQPGPSLLESIENFFQSNGMQLLMQVLGLVMGVKLVLDGLSWLKGKLTSQQQENGGDPPNGDQVQQAQQEAQGVEADNAAAQQDVADRLGDGAPQIPDPAALPQAQDDAQVALEEQQIQERVDSEEEEIEAQADELQVEAEVESTSEMEQIALDERAEMGELEQIDPFDVSASESTLDAVQGAVGQDQVAVDAIEQQEGGELSSQEQAEVEAAEEAAQEEEEEQQEEDDAEADDEAGDDLEDL